MTLRTLQAPILRRKHEDASVKTLLRALAYFPIANLQPQYQHLHTMASEERHSRRLCLKVRPRCSRRLSNLNEALSPFARCSIGGPNPTCSLCKLTHPRLLRSMNAINMVLFVWLSPYTLLFKDNPTHIQIPSECLRTYYDVVLLTFLLYVPREMWSAQLASRIGSNLKRIFTLCSYCSKYFDISQHLYPLSLTRASCSALTLLIDATSFEIHLPAALHGSKRQPFRRSRLLHWVCADLPKPPSRTTSTAFGATLFLCLPSHSLRLLAAPSLFLELIWIG